MEVLIYCMSHIHLMGHYRQDDENGVSLCRKLWKLLSVSHTADCHASRANSVMVNKFEHMLIIFKNKSILPYLTIFSFLMSALKYCLLQLQQEEEELIRKRAANSTALAAIGPRKKRKLDEALEGGSPASKAVSIFK